MNDVDVNAVFEGGGVKAIAFVGAIKAAEEKNVRFARMAGTSSGAIVASFLAAGYRADEMKRIILETPFTMFLEKTWLNRVKVIGPAVRLFVKKGLYSGNRLEQWVAEKLKARGIRTFGDLPKDKLRIIASDISQGKLLVLPDDIAQYGVDPRNFPIARAVRMSTSIPYFFDPVVFRKPAKVRKKGERFSDQFVYIVDGGLLSNFPLWLFDRKQLNNKDHEMIPTIGFRLVGRNDRAPRKIVGPITMFHALFSTMMEAHDERYIEEKNRFRTIKIPTFDVRVTDFDITPEQSMKLYDSGYRAANKYFDKWSHEQYVALFNKWVSTVKV